MVFFIILIRTKGFGKNIHMMSSLLSYSTNANACFYFFLKFQHGLQNKVFLNQSNTHKNKCVST